MLNFTVSKRLGAEKNVNMRALPTLTITNFERMKETVRDCIKRSIQRSSLRRATVALHESKSLLIYLDYRGSICQNIVDSIAHYLVYCIGFLELLMWRFLSFFNCFFFFRLKMPRKM